jgi:hypothetical protein
MQTSTSGQNLDTVLDAFKWNKVGNTRDWVIHPQRMIKGPKQTHLMCVVACSMFCFWKAGALQAKSTWIESEPTPNDWFDWRSKRSQDYAQGIREGIQGSVRGCYTINLRTVTS